MDDFSTEQRNKIVKIARLLTKNASCNTQDKILQGMIPRNSIAKTLADGRFNSWSPSVTLSLSSRIVKVSEEEKVAVLSQIPYNPYYLTKEQLSAVIDHLKIVLEELNTTKSIWDQVEKILKE